MLCRACCWSTPTRQGINLTLDLIRAALQESERPRAGGETILSKLSELMFMQALRQHIDGLPPEATGWLSGLRDRHVGMALRLMHDRPAERWTIDALAREVGLSRSAFAERFTQLMGMPSMHYLGNWRLQLAAQMLERHGTSVAQAAARSRLRVGGRVQPRVQEAGGRAAGVVAARTDG